MSEIGNKVFQNLYSPTDLKEILDLIFVKISKEQRNSRLATTNGRDS